MKSAFDTRSGNDSPGAKTEIPLPSPDQLSRLFPQLEIIELLGRGGMGAVYKARQRNLNRLVALKILAPDKQDDPQFAERFAREGAALASLNHPHIVTVYDFGETEGHCFLLMEFVDGLTLRQLMQQRRLSAPEALALIPQICQALQYAHERAIVHRDIKPENILLDTTGQVKITDFGIAKLLKPEPQNISLTSAQHIVGTLLYMAPEQIENPKAVDHRADIFSLGVVFYEMLTGELPIGKFQPPSQKVQVDARLDEVVLRALEKEPERRYQTVTHIRSDLEAIAGTAGKKDSVLGRLARRPKAAVLGAGFATLLLLLLARLVIPGRPEPPPPPNEYLVALWSGEKDARDRVGTNDGELVNVAFTQGVSGWAFHLDGSNAFVRIPDAPSHKPADLTVEAWVKFDTLVSPGASEPGQQIIVFKLNSRNPRRGNFEGYCLFKNTNQFTFTITSSNGLQVSANSLSVPQAGRWYHLAGTYDSFDTNVAIYVNGVLEGSAHANFPLDCGTSPLFIGTTGEWWDGRLQGSVDEVALYKRAMRVNEIHDRFAVVRAWSPQLFPTPPVIPEEDAARTNAPSARSSLVARWSAAEGGGDSAGAHAARLEHVTSLPTEAGPVFAFNGSNASIRIPARPELNVGLGEGFTVAAWIKPESPKFQSVWEWNRNDGIPSGTRQAGVQLLINEGCGSGALLGGIVDTDGVAHSIYTTNDVVRLNRFQHVAMTYDQPSGIAALYRDGSMVARMNVGVFTPQTGFDFFIGRRPSGSFTGIHFQGQMDRIAIYRRALTAAEIGAGHAAESKAFTSAGQP